MSNEKNIQASSMSRLTFGEKYITISVRQTRRYRAPKSQLYGDKLRNSMTHELAGYRKYEVNISLNQGRKRLTQLTRIFRVSVSDIKDPIKNWLANHADPTEDFMQLVIDTVIDLRNETDDELDKKVPGSEAEDEQD